MIDLRPAYWIMMTGNVIERPNDGYDNRCLNLPAMVAYAEHEIDRAVRLGFTRIVLPMWPGQRLTQDSWTASAWRSTPEFIKQLHRSGYVAAWSRNHCCTFAYYNGGFMDPADPNGDTNWVDERTKVRMDPAIPHHATYLEEALCPLKIYSGPGFQEVWIDQSGGDLGIAARMKLFLQGMGIRNLALEGHVVKFNNPQDAMMGGQLVDVPYTTVSTQDLMAWDTNKDWRANRATADRHIRILNPSTPLMQIHDWAERGFVIDVGGGLSDEMTRAVRDMSLVPLRAPAPPVVN